MTPDQTASLIDHTLLKSDASQTDIVTLCADAIKYNFKSICINPYWVPFCSTLLQASPVSICTVVGFPLGATATNVKTHETEWSIKNGADEIDMVINIGELKSDNDKLVFQDIATIKSICHNKTLKVIIETALLTNNEINKACLIAKRAKADFVKTSTGFSSRGAILEDIKLMRAAIGNDMEIKASGGIKTYTDLLNMINAGATRIGTSSGIQILKDCASQEKLI